MKSNEVRLACDWSTDGRFVLYRDFDDRVGAYDLRAVPMNGERTPITVAASVYDERDGQFSPDGKWVAFQTDEAGQPAIFMQPFPGPGAKVRVSQGAGTQVRWNRSGREIFYIDGEDRLVAVPISYGRDGQPVIGAATPLFTARVPFPGTVSRQAYDVSPDGTRFLFSMRRDEGGVGPITLVLNWKLKR